MATSFKIYYGGTYQDIPSDYVLYAELKDNGRRAVNELQMSFNRIVLGTTYDPLYSSNIKMNVGSAEVFGGTIERPEREDVLLNVSAYSFGAEFLYRYVNEIFENVSPEYIVEYIITNYTSLTYASSVTTGITIERIVFRDKPVVEVLQLISDTLDYVFYTDVNKNAYFEARGTVSSGQVLTVGDSTATYRVVNKPVWNYNTDYIITKVIVEGDKQRFEKNESFTASASQTDFSLVYEPEDVEVKVNSVVKAPTVSSSTVGDYEVKREDKTIVFITPLTGGETVDIKYVYAIPIKVTAISDQTDTQGSTIIRERKVVNKSIKEFQEARNFAQKYLDAHSQPQKSTEIEILGYNSSLLVGRTVRVVDATESINEDFVITNVSYSYPDEITTINVGTEEPILYDWQKEVMERLREISQQDANVDILQDYKQFKSNLVVNLGTTGLLYERSMEDSLIANHTTLGYAREDLNVEIDCSGNGNHGTWQGTGIDGSQYSTSGYRLSMGQFNGSDNSITSTGVSETGITCVTLFIDEDTNSRGLLTLDTGKTISLDGSGGITTSGLTGVTAEKTIVTGSWSFVYVEFDAITLTNPVAGYDGSTYYDGDMDELLAFNTNLSSQDKADIKNKAFYSNHSKYGNCKLWWSMDNPRAGDRRGSFVNVENL